MAERDLIDEILEAKVKATLFGGDRAPRLGRLVILEPIGSGAMGTVFSAFDPRLDRKVAVKLLRGLGPSSRERIVLEARALGKLNHPNVVVVHDVDEVGESLFLVMELAPGASLRAWMEPRKPWREVARVMTQVGAGLAAAHRAGLVHRDIKPDNVLIGPDRARIVDFGLAQSRESGDAARGGTPSYMAPEVLDGGPATPASDQFSFGVTLYEALYGERPHHGATKQELGRAARSPKSEAKARASRGDVPAWLHRVALRALAPDPAQRFPSMDELCAELGRDRRQRRRLAAGLGGALALACVAAGLAYSGGAARDACAGGDARRGEVWTPELERKLRAALGDAPWATKAVDDLGAISGDWAGSYRRVCEATRVHGGQSDALLELRMRCLDRRLSQFESLSLAISKADTTETRLQATSAIAALPRASSCEALTDAGELALPDDSAKRQRAHEIERHLDRAWSAWALGDYRAAKAASSEIDGELAGLDLARLRAEALFLGGSVEARTGDPASAQRRLEDALREAAVAGAHRLEVDIWARLLRGELFAGNPTHVIEWAPFARASAARAGLAGADLDGVVGEARRDAGELAQARALIEGALAHGAELRGDQRALLEMNLGSIELAAGRVVRAEEAFDRAQSESRRAQGEGHPTLALYIDKQAEAARARGALRQALADHDRALALREAAFGEVDRAVASSLLHRAQTKIESGQLRAAEEDLGRARSIRERVHGERHVRLGEIELVLGDLAAARGQLDVAREHYDQVALLDPRLDVTARRAAVGVAIDPSKVRPLGADEELSIVRAGALAARAAALEPRDHGAASAEVAVLSARTPRGAGVAAPLLVRVAAALLASGSREAAAALYRDALAALADEPSRTRLEATVGLARTSSDDEARQAAKAAARLLEAMPELDPRARAELDRLAK